MRGGKVEVTLRNVFLNSNSIGNSRATGLSVEDCCVSPSLNKVDLFIYLFYFLVLRFGGEREGGLCIAFS